MANPMVQPAPFPVPSRTASEVINNTLTTAISYAFADKILITISCSAVGNKLAHWVHVPLASSTNLMEPGFMSSAPADSTDTSLLPRGDLTATTVLGGTKREDEVIGQTLATIVASAILTKRASEERLLVLGLGLQGLGEDGLGRNDFEQVIGLVLGVI